MADDAPRDPWVEGIELFNAGRFFDCHEAWEEVWKPARGRDKLFYQGMIQAAVAILHVERGNLRGARSTWQKARFKLYSFPAEHRGIALGELREAVDAFVAAAGPDHRTRGTRPQPPPKILLS
jgi:predicted metal-dependent hydrolase